MTVSSVSREITEIAVGRPAGATRRRISELPWLLDTPAGLVSMFAVALVTRLLIAPHAGFYGDLRLFRLWAERLDEVGTHHFYVAGQFADYPPGYLYVLWMLGKLSAAPGYLLLKVPALLADLALAWIVGTMAARLAPVSTTRRWPVRPLAAAAVLFNPAVIGLGAVWGQVDALTATFVLCSLLLLFTGTPSLRSEIAAFALFAVAVAMKPQSGFVLPVMLYALYRRYLHRRPLSEWFDGVLSIATAGVTSLGIWAVSGLPFGLGPVSLLRFYSHSASVYPVTSANAFNLWGAIGFWRSDSRGESVMTLAGLPAVRVGTLAFLLGIAIVLWLAHRAIERGAHEARVLTVAAAETSLLAYTLLTRMHERYMFVALAAFAPLVFVRPIRLAYAGLSALFVLNLWYPYAYFNSQWRVQDFHFQPWFDWILGGYVTDTWQKRIWSAAVTGIALMLVWRGVRWAARAEAVGAAGGWSGELRPPALGLPRVSSAVRAALTEKTVAVSATARVRWGPVVLVGLTCLLFLVVLRGETRPVPNLNDSTFHQQMVRWADGQIGESRVPFDGWYPYLSLGSSQFHHYQSLPHILTASTARATGGSADGTFLWILYLLLALWPIAVFWGARLADWPGWTAAAAAAISPLIVSTPGYGYEHNSYTWQGYGVYSQLWAMWLLPLAWGFTWRAVSRGSHYAAAALALALTMACHFITGYLAVLTVGVWVLLAGGPTLVRRAARGAMTVGGALLVASWVLVPLVGDTKWTTRSAYYTGTIFNDSFGAGKVVGWLFTGKLFDAGRFPVVTTFFTVGLVVCAAQARRDPRARALLGAFGLSLLLFFGRPTLGPVLDILPGMGDVQIHRFIVGVHLAGILIAGVGLGQLLKLATRFAHRLPSRRAPMLAGAVSIAVAIGLLAPAWTERVDYDRSGDKLMEQQRSADATDGRDLDRLVAVVKARGGGRVYAGLRGNWGHDYVVGEVPVYAWLAGHDVDAIGFTFRTIASLSTDVEAAFDEANAAQFQMFNVRYLLLPSDRTPPVPATLIARSGRHRLWQTQTTGYLQVVDRAPAVRANRSDLEVATREFRQSNLASVGTYPSVAFAGATEAPPTFSGAAPPSGSPGTVVQQTYALSDGVFRATVDATRPATVLLKTTFDPRWTAIVDGLPAQPLMMAPSLVGVDVPVGHHVVQFRYRPYGRYPALLGVGALSLLALLVVPSTPARRRRLARLRG